MYCLSHILLLYAIISQMSISLQHSKFYTLELTLYGYEETV